MLSPMMSNVIKKSSLMFAFAPTSVENTRVPPSLAVPPAAWIVSAGDVVITWDEFTAAAGIVREMTSGAEIS